MTELEWLMQESGLTADEWKAYEALGTTTKLITAVKKAMGLSDQALKDKVAAENERIAFEKRYNDEFIPEMRRVTQDALTARGEAARLEAQLAQAREYGIVPEPPKPAAPATEPPRAPGSPDPAAQFAQWAAAQSRALNTLSEIGSEHFKLFKEPLPSSADLAEMVTREHTLGHRDYTLRNAWESKYNIPTKRAEIQQAEQQKVIDERVQAALKEDRAKRSSHPGQVTGQPSRFGTYNQSDGGAKEPWKIPPAQKKASNAPWRQKFAEKIAAA